MRARIGRDWKPWQDRDPWVLREYPDNWEEPWGWNCDGNHWGHRVVGGTSRTWEDARDDIEAHYRTEHS